MFSSLAMLSPFDFGDMDDLRDTAVWASTEMQHMDWVDRHALFRVFVDTKPHAFCVMVAQQFGPDVLLDGMATGRPPAVIIMQGDKPKVQKMITRYFAQRVD